MNRDKEDMNFCHELIRDFRKRKCLICRLVTYYPGQLCLQCIMNPNVPCRQARMSRRGGRKKAEETSPLAGGPSQ